MKHEIEGCYNAKVIRLLNNCTDAEKEMARKYIREKVPERFKEQVGFTCLIHIKKFEVKK